MKAWKILAIALVGYSLYAGLMFDVPRLVILNETIRNLYFHVPMWFTMITLLGGSLVYSFHYLRSGSDGQPASMDRDNQARSFAEVAMIFSLLGLFTGMVWAKATWGTYWTADPKLNGTAVTLLIYASYFILRSSVDDAEKRARLAAVYNVFAFVLMIVFIGILPRMTDSLHPGNGGNPAFGNYDLDDRMRMVFYPAALGWILMGWWIATLRVRMERLRHQNTF
ncbi:MAG: cytochrome c biogenesis protein CcsA [Schleiferiaceae bacterium]|nr:cytochrome c biogenesis protein CcsA [Schleiferiaceae bacterium]